MATLAMNRPDINPPKQCDVSGPLQCVTSAKDTTTVKLLMTPTSQRNLNVTNATLTYLGDTAQYCDITDMATGSTGRGPFLIDRNDQVDITCNLSELSLSRSTFLEEREEMQISLTYREQGLRFHKEAETSLLI